MSSLTVLILAPNNSREWIFATRDGLIAGIEDALRSHWAHRLQHCKTLYVDGQVDARTSDTATVSTNSDINVNVGRRFNIEYTVGQYDGLLDDVRIFKRGLSQAEIQEIVSEATP
ncbi:MAG: LamG-like jellyroll fold domain-containing protein [Polyangiales bacterium]